MRVRLVDLDDRDIALAQIAHQAGGVAAGRLDRNRLEGSVAPQPRQRLGVAGGGRWEASAAQHRAAVIERRDVVRVGVRVNAADDERHLLRHALHGCHSCPGLGGLVEKGGQNSDEAL